MGSDELAVDRLRGLVAHRMVTKPSCRATVTNLLLTLRQCPHAKADFPLVVERDRDLHGLESLAAAVLRNGTWASQIEHGIIKDLLGKLDVALITLECRDKRSLAEDTVVEEQLLRALKATAHTHCVVLIHLANSHYMYMTLDHVSVPETDTLLSYITTFLDD